MKTKETMAFVGRIDENYAHLIHKLASKKYPLVFIADDGRYPSEMPDQIRAAIPYADIESRDCIKEGCWEADIIVFPGATDFATEAVKKMREVCTQKILICLTGNEGEAASGRERIKSLQQLFPDSKITGVICKPAALEVNITGNDEESVALISEIFTGLGYKTII